MGTREVREYLEELCGQIFEEQLDGWYLVPSSWPSRRDLDAFDRWFEWSFHSMVVDLCDDPLFQEESYLCGGVLGRPPIPDSRFWTLQGSVYRQG